MRSNNLELEFSRVALQYQHLKSPLTSALKKAWQHFIQFLTSGNDLRIWTTTDRQGHTIWHAYDPVSNCSISLSSESEMRAWLEQRYYL